MTWRWFSRVLTKRSRSIGLPVQSFRGPSNRRYGGRDRHWALASVCMVLQSHQLVTFRTYRGCLNRPGSSTPLLWFYITEELEDVFLEHGTHSRPSCISRIVKPSP